jgi:hypothetical protein
LKILYECGGDRFFHAEKPSRGVGDSAASVSPSKTLENTQNLRCKPWLGFPKWRIFQNPWKSSSQNGQSDLASQ